MARADSNEANDKAIVVNEELRRICEEGDIELISNSNINPQKNTFEEIMRKEIVGDTNPSSSGIDGHSLKGF